jgi:hypothetical protein
MPTGLRSPLARSLEDPLRRGFEAGIRQTEVRSVPFAAFAERVLRQVATRLRRTGAAFDEPALAAALEVTVLPDLYHATACDSGDEAAWNSLVDGYGPRLRTLTVFTSNRVSRLYAGGGFASSGVLPRNDLASWNGSSWTLLITSLVNGVAALQVFDDGTGPALYVGGTFLTAGNVPATSIAQRTGTTWQALGSGLAPLYSGTLPEVSALRGFDDGSGPALTAGGTFSTAGGPATGGVARWNGASWSSVGSGLGAGVTTLAVFNGGVGPLLYAEGVFRHDYATAPWPSYVVRFDGSAWVEVTGGVRGFDGPVKALAVHADGFGTALWVGGAFTRAGGVPATGIAVWNGWYWSAAGGGVTVYDDGSGPALIA